jgi:hypothetical protein
MVAMKARVRATVIPLSALVLRGALVVFAVARTSSRDDFGDEERFAEPPGAGYISAPHDDSSIHRYA